MGHTDSVVHCDEAHNDIHGDSHCDESGLYHIDEPHGDGPAHHRPSWRHRSSG